MNASRRRWGDALFWTAVAAMVAFLAIPESTFRRPPAPPLRIGHAPAPNVLADPLRKDRLYSGSSVSTDGGQTWTDLTDAQGTRAVLLGGRHALPPAVSPQGKVLLGEVLFDGARWRFGHGIIAPAAEWNNGSWRIVARQRPEDRLQPRLRVTDLDYEPFSDRAVVAMDHELLGPVEIEAPGPITAAVMTTAPYVAVSAQGKFSLYTMASTDVWLPVAGAPRGIVDLDRSRTGLICAAGEQFGCGVAGKWIWSAWPDGFSPERILIHPKEPQKIAAWGKGRLIASRDRGITFADIETPRIQVVFATWDPFRENTLLVVNGADGDLYRLTL